MALKLILSDEKSWECLEKVENEYKRYSIKFFNSVRQSSILEELKSSD